MEGQGGWFFGFVLIYLIGGSSGGVFCRGNGSIWRDWAVSKIGLIK